MTCDPILLAEKMRDSPNVHLQPASKKLAPMSVIQPSYQRGVPKIAVEAVNVSLGIIGILMAGV